MSPHSTLSRVVLRNYKSIQSCDVSLGPLTFLVGPNGAGKSNFVEAIRLVSYGLSTSIEQAVADRSGFQSILHTGAAPSSAVSFEFYCDLGGGASAYYSVALEAPGDGPVVVSGEKCFVRSPDTEVWFRVTRGVVESNQGIMPSASEEKLYLVNASGLAAFEPLYRTLSNIAVYNPVPDQIRLLQPEKRYRNLDRTGSALAETVFKLKASKPERLARITEYLRRINPDVTGLDAIALDENYTLRFDLCPSAGVERQFLARNLSDGTLRSLAILVAIFQYTDRFPLNTIALEEPEAGLHPAAAGVLFDSLIEGSGLRQIIVTSHSPDLLDREDIPENALRAVVMDQGRTIIGEADAISKGAMRGRLYTAGELMRMDQLRPESQPA